MRTPILFLDIDGVLNSDNYRRVLHTIGVPLDQIQNEFDPKCVEAINRILSTTKAQVVVSSTWRNQSKDLSHELRSRGVNIDGHFLGQTPHLPNAERGQEIRLWLVRNHAQASSFAVLDDDRDMLGVAHRLVQTSRFNGLTEADADVAIRMLRS